MAFFGLFGPPDVQKLKANRDIEGLIKALDYEKDLSVRSAAADALGKTGDARAVEPLITILKDGDKDVRKAAADALDKLGWKPDLGEDGTWYWIAKKDWRKCAIIGASAVEPLITVLKDRDKDVRKVAAYALDKLGWKSDHGEDSAWYWIAKEDWEKCVDIGTPAVDALIFVFMDGDTEIRRAALLALREIRDARAVKPLIVALEDKDKYIRTVAAEALKKIYHSGQLDQQAKNQILGMQSVMAHHEDTHGDQMKDISYAPSDCNSAGVRHIDSHTDIGIGVTL
jgi:hypothetical protein